MSSGANGYMTTSFNEAQKCAVEHNQGSLLVSAGAGSGKTRVLVERIVNALCGASAEEPYAIDSILTITFTNKAADELKDRVARELRARRRDDLASRIDEMWVSTIHGMYARILRAHAFECGLSPTFTLVDEVQNEALKIEAFEKAVIRYRENHKEDVVKEDVQNQSALGVNILGRYTYEELYEGVNALLPYVLDDKPLIPHEDSEYPEGAAINIYAQNFIDLAQEFAHAYIKEKDKRALLDYDDLERKAYELLSKNQYARMLYQSKFKLIQIDEFQDTNEAQLKAIALLAKDGFYSVGDAQQSIYRFRGADVATYQAYAASLDDGSKISLTKNYRSHQEIVQFSNAVFGSSPLFEGMFLEMEAARDEERRKTEFMFPTDMPRISVDLYGLCSRTAKKDPARIYHAARVAEQIKELVKDRDVSGGDIAILMRASTNMKVYLDALIAVGVDAVISGGGAFFDEPIVGVFEQLARVLANPQDEKALLTVLSSQIFRLSDAALFALEEARQGVSQNQDQKQAQTHVQARALFDALREQVTTTLSVFSEQDLQDATLAYTVLHDAMTRLGKDDLSVIFEDIISDSGLDLCLLGQGARGRQQYAFVLKLLQLADTFEEGATSGPASFAHMLKQQRTLHSKEGLSTLPGEGDGAVRIMTIHAAKGLEFPIVFVPDLDSAVIKSGNALVRVDERVTPAQVVVNLPSAERGPDCAQPPELFAELKAEEEAAEAQEFARLFYVAITRAQDALYLAGAPPQKVTEGNTAEKLGTPLFERFIAGQMQFPEAPDEGINTTTFGIRVGKTSEEFVEQKDSPIIQCHLHSIAREYDPSEGANEVLTTSSTAVGEKSDSTLSALILDHLPLDPMGNGSRKHDVDAHDFRDYLPSRISYSGFSAYKECPRRFEAERLYHVGELHLEEEREEATAFGSAFHVLAELYARQRHVSRQRIEAVGAYHGLDALTVERLASALDRWITSDVAVALFDETGATPEVPFSIKLGAQERGSNEGITLDGSIDLMKNDGLCTTIVDYKTGTERKLDTVERLRDRYYLQAECYALAPLRSGQEHVEILFVRPEVETTASQMQHIAFSFTQSDRLAIEEKLLAIFEEIKQGHFDPLPSYNKEVCDSCPIKQTLCKVG